jgi:hypothetical protein
MNRGRREYLLERVNRKKTMTEIPPNHVTIAVRKIGGADANKARVEIVHLLLRQMVDGLKARLDPASWVNGGWPELSAFVDALEAGGAHPVLAEWESARTKGGRPAPSTREAYGRRLAILLCAALERAGLNRRAARQFAATELGAAGLFDGTISPKTLEHWRERASPMTPGDELLVATGFATAGGEPRKLALYFIGMVHAVTNPTAMIVRESAPEPPGYMGRFLIGK